METFLHIWRRPMVSIKDIAKKAGVSVSTVSRCINNSGYTSAKTKEKVLAICEEMNFKPMLSARIMKTKKSNIIALLIPTLRNSFFVELASYVERECFKHGYKMILCNINEDEIIEESYIDMIQQQSFDGAIVATGTKMATKLKDIPLVFLDRIYLEADNCSMVTCDHYGGAVLAVDYLIRKGSKKILHITPTLEIDPANLRLQGYKYMMNSNNLPVHIKKYSENEEIFDIDYRQYDGVFVWNDSLAIELIHHLIKHGFSIPKDIQIIGFDNSFLAATLYPGLTTIDQPYEELATSAIELLMNRINKEDLIIESKVLPTKLVIRDTTR